MPIEDFQIGKILGKGAFSSVLLVKRIQDNKTYAMKRVKIGQLSPKDKQNALNEIRILASLSHNNIIGYKEAFFDDITQTLNIVMEYADEGDLQSKIRNNQKKKLFFTENTIWNILIQVLEGLKYLHENNIIHRDLKSANIFLNKNGNIKIGDLNVSKVTQHGFASTHTGTPYYASPEVWKDNPYDYKCDIWSFGVILYELCTLKVPFRGTNLKTLVKNINSGKYEPISNHYSKNLHLILSYMLVVNPHKRKSAKELLELDFVIEKTEGFLMQTKKGQAILMNTIKMPGNMKDINRALPKKRYNDNEKMKENDEYEIMKESIKEGGFGNINFKELINENDGKNNNNIKDNNANKDYSNNFDFQKERKPIIVKKINAIEDLYDKIFNRKNNNNYLYGNNNYENRINSENNNNKRIKNVINNVKMQDLIKDNYLHKELNNERQIDNQNKNINYNKGGIDNNKKEYNYEYQKNDSKKIKIENLDEIMGKLEHKINNYKNEAENFRNKWNNANKNEGNNNQNNFVSKINLINNNNNNNNYNFRNDNENEKRKQLMNKINKIKMNYNKNHNQQNNKYEQLFEKNNLKDNNNKNIAHHYFRNENNNNNQNKNYELFENEFKNLENKYKYNKQQRKEYSNNIQKNYNYNHNHNNNIFSNQERVNQRPISANINNYNLNKGDDFFNQFKEKYNINRNVNNNRDKSPLIGRRNYNFNDYMKNNKINNNNNYFINYNQYEDKNSYKYQNNILKKPNNFSSLFQKQ